MVAWWWVPVAFVGGSVAVGLVALVVGLREMMVRMQAAQAEIDRWPCVCGHIYDEHADGGRGCHAALRCRDKAGRALRCPCLEFNLDTGRPRANEQNDGDRKA